MNSTASSSASEIRLAPAGAGLPFPENVIAKILFHTLNALNTLSDSKKTLLEESEAITGLLKGLSEAQKGTPTLIKRLRGLEDSSRNWSIHMTLEHLSIVQERVAAILGQLMKGHSPEGMGRPADVKPSPSAGVESEERFARSVLAVVGRMPVSEKELNSKAVFVHQWFGPLNAKSWFFMIGFHLKLHRKQIEAILSEQKNRVGVHS